MQQLPHHSQAATIVIHAGQYARELASVALHHGVKEVGAAACAVGNIDLILQTASSVLAGIVMKCYMNTLECAASIRHLRQLSAILLLRPGTATLSNTYSSMRFSKSHGLHIKTD